jgi:oligopeptide transport system ATP-binding protein
MSLLHVDNLTKTFPLGGSLFGEQRSVQAVRGVSFGIEEGETLGLVGESGCGKSTLGRCIIRLIEPTSGSVRFKGRDLCALSALEMRRARCDMQIIFQDPYSSLNPRMRVGEIVQEGLEIHDLTPRENRRDRVISLLESVGLKAEHELSYPHEFSGGQRQRIGIARALAVNPQFLVADEAVSALDVSIQAQILNLFMELQARLKLTYLFISHNLHVVRHVSDRVAVMYLGKIVEIAPADEIYHRPLHPYTQALLSAALSPDPDKRKTRTKLEGDVPSPINPPRGCAFHTRCPIAEAKCRQIDPGLVYSGRHGVACHKVEA